ncbi:MAG TPA: glycosyltransferase family 4 protein, partial [Phycisphaerae bacterium]|nr:glycosyltransferase family 4 protein [Phycisphaerae bacterium]
MRILWHMPVLNRCGCGLSTRAVKLAREVVRRGHQVQFVVRAGRTDAGESIEGIPVSEITAAEGRPVHWSFQQHARMTTVCRVVDRIEPAHDLFISCQPEAIGRYKIKFPNQPAMFVCGGTTLLHDAANEMRRGRLSMLRQIPFRVDRSLKRRHERDAFRRADAVVFDSATTRTLVTNHYGVDPKKCHAILGGVDQDEFFPPSPAQREQARKSLNTRDGEFVIAWTGRLSPEKNVELLLRAVGRCTSAPRLLIVGDGNLRDSLELLAHSLQIADRVSFAGRQTDVSPYLHAADLFVFPSMGESFGGALAEAMACALPCVALRADSQMVRNAANEIFQDGECGRLVSSTAPAALAASIDDLLASPEARRELAARAAVRAREHFTWRSAGAALARVVEELASRKT